MFHDIGAAGRPVPQQSDWVYTVDHFGKIENRGSGPYSSLHTGKYSADDNWRLQQYDPSLPTDGNWKPITPLQDISG